MNALIRPLAKIKSASLFKHYSELSVVKKSSLGFSTVLAALVLPGAAFALQSNNDSNQSPSIDDSAQTTQSSTDSSDNDYKADVDSHGATAHNTAITSSSSSNINVSVPANSPSPKSYASVSINGQNVPVPSNGNVSKTIKSTDSKTEVDISIKGNGSSSSSSYTDIQINSSTNSNGLDGGSRFMPRR